ncbi:MAG: hypothetical protein DWC07_02165, partial [Candidatus Poseidoniales archaeon]
MFDDHGVDHDSTTNAPHLNMRARANLCQGSSSLFTMAGGSFVLPKPRPNGPPFFSRNQVANVLHQVAVLLELQGANV